MREDHYEENNTRNFIPTPDPGRHSSADRERTAPSAPPPLHCGEMAPGPARTGALPLAGGQHRDRTAPRGDPLRHRTVQHLPSGSRTVLRRSGRGRLPPRRGRRRSQDSGPDRSSAFVWTARREGASLELRFRDDRLLLLWNRPRPSYQFFCSLPESAADAAVSTPATAAAASCR